MKNLPFVIWLLSYPLSQAFTVFIYEHELEREYTGSVKLINAVITLTVYGVVAVLLYEP